MRKLMALMALTILTACDYAERKNLRDERDSHQYRVAMEKYRAGQLGEAIGSFTEALKADPGNSSARFQLACLLQDVRKDYVGAYCGYREYLQLFPASDKVELIQGRLAACEKEVARVLSAKYAIKESGDGGEIILSLRKDLQSALDRAAAAEKAMTAALTRTRALSVERDRLLAMVKGESAAVAPKVAQSAVKEARDLLEEVDADTCTSGTKDEIARLKEEEASDLSVSSPSLSEVRAIAAEDDADAKTAKPVDLSNRVSSGSARVTAEKVEKAKPAVPAPARPKSHLVQEGDTLYGVAKRYYGTSSAWKAIRNANRALISADNRLHAGERIVLP